MNKQVKIRMYKYPWPINHTPADAESEINLKKYTGWTWIPWPQLDIFIGILASNEIELVTIERDGLRVGDYE